MSGSTYSPGDKLELGWAPFDELSGPLGPGVYDALGNFIPGSHRGATAEQLADGWTWSVIDSTQGDLAEQLVALGYANLQRKYPSTFNRDKYNTPLWHRFIAGTVASTVPPSPPPPPDPLPVLSGADPTWGQVIPQSFGVRRVDGVPIWLGSVSRIADFGFVGAVDFAVAFGTTARPADDLRLVELARLWANGILVYDSITPGAPIVQTGMTVTFYPGLPDAQPDPTIVAAQGSSAPAFRDLMYAVIRGFPLQRNDTSVPHMRAELRDVPAFVAPVLTEYEVLDPPTQIHNTGLAVDWDTGTLFGISSRFTDPHILHSYDIATQTEISAVELDGTLLTSEVTDPPNQFDDIFSDIWTVYDKYNGLIHWQNGPFLSNSIRISSFKADTGVMISSFGNSSSQLESGDNAAAFSLCADLFRFRAWGATIHGIQTGGLASREVGIFTYRSAAGPINPQNGVMLDRVGQLVPGNKFALGYETRYDTVNAVTTLCPYPVLDRPELIADFQVTERDHQDAVFMWGDGTQLFVAQGNLIGTSVASVPGTLAESLIEWQTNVPPRALFDFGINLVKNIFVDPTTGCVMVIALDPAATGAGLLYKLRPTWTLTATGATMVTLEQQYATPIDGINALPLNSVLKLSRLDAGSFAYLNGNPINVVSLATGQKIYQQSTSIGAANADFVYDSIFATLVCPLGNGTPALVTKVDLRAGSTTDIPVTDFLTWCALRLGYAIGDISVDANITEDVQGGNITSPASVRQAMTTVCAMYGVSAVEMSGTIRFVRPLPGEQADIAAVFTNEDLSRLQESSEDSLSTTALAADELPADIQVGYLDPDNDYRENAQVYRRVRFPFQNVKNKGRVTYSAPLVISSGDALSIAGRIALSSFGQSTTYEYRLPHRYVNLVPSDVVAFLADDKITINELSQITQVTYNGDWSMTLKGVRWSLSDTLIINADAPAGRQTQQMKGPSDSVALAFDVPYIEPTDVVPGSAMVYTAAGSLGQSYWESAQITRTLDSSTAPLYTTDVNVPWGAVQEVLPATEAAGTTFSTDPTVLNVIGKSLLSSMVRTVTAEECRQGKNAALIGAPGRWELVYFQNVEVVTARHVRLTGLLRGRRGTNVSCDKHSSGDQFVLVKSLGARTALRGDNLSAAFRSKLLTYYAVGVNTHRPSVPISFTFQAASEKPWTVRRVRAVYGDEVNLVAAPDYTNECGQGNRLDVINVIASYKLPDGTEHPSAPLVDESPYNLVDGSVVASAAHSTRLFSGLTDAIFVFDFTKSGFKQIINEITWLQSTSDSIGTYDIEATVDGNTWDSLATAVDLAAASGIHSFSNTTGYWTYRLRQTGGSASATPRLLEVKFKTMADADPDDVLITWLRRDRLKPAVLFVEDDQPQSELTELYTVDILASDTSGLTYTPIRTLPLTTGPRAVYTAAQQAEDGLTPPLATLGLRVSQLGVGGTVADRAGFSDIKIVEVT